MSRKRTKSIIYQPEGTCYLCMLLNDDYREKPVLQEHHIYPGSNRQASEENGLKVKLCPDHHVFGAEAVHNNIDNLRILQRIGQQVYEQGHTRGDFMRIFGRNYL